MNIHWKDWCWSWNSNTQRANSLEKKTLMLGKIEGRRRRGWQRTRWLEGITDSMDMSLSKLWKMVKDREAWPAADHGGHKESDTTEQLNNNIGLPSGHVWLWELDGKEGRALNRYQKSSWRKSYDQPRQRIKQQRHYFANKGPSSQGYYFSSSHVWIWELDYKESWVPKN